MWIGKEARFVLRFRRSDLDVLAFSNSDTGIVTVTA